MIIICSRRVRVAEVVEEWIFIIILFSWCFWCVYRGHGSGEPQYASKEVFFTWFFLAVIRRCVQKILFGLCYRKQVKSSIRGQPHALHGQQFLIYFFFEAICYCYR
jgi:hypothetical protein